MLMINYDENQGWHDERIVPYQNLDMDPACMVLHYGQAIFEGMKAYKASDGRVLMFRPEDNINRMNRSGSRLCIPPLPVEKVVACIEKLCGNRKRLDSHGPQYFALYPSYNNRNRCGSWRTRFQKLSVLCNSFPRRPLL